MNKVDDIHKQIQDIRERLVPNLIPEDERSNEATCPLCEGEGSVDSRNWVYQTLAAGCQVFGIGDDLERMETFIKNAPGDIEFLLQKVSEQSKEIDKLKQALEIGRGAMS